MKLISPKYIYYGADSTNEVKNILLNLRSEKVYILCDPILERLGITKKLKDILNSFNVDFIISTNVTAEPTVEKGNEILKEVRGENIDLIIGLGGGSTLDLAKAAALIAPQKGGIENYLNLTGDKKLEDKKITSILMPSTSGTGAEVTDIAVFSTGQSKDAITNPLMIANYAIIDPIYSYSLPPKIAAASGIDALTHALEAYTSIEATPITDQLSIGAIEKVYNNIREAVWDKNNLQAKNELSLASLMAGLSFYNAGVAGVHALAYPLGGKFNIPHGESNAVLLPYVYENIAKSCSKKLSTLASIFKISEKNKNSIEISNEIIVKLFSLVDEVGLPKSLREYDISEKDIDYLTQNALKQIRLLNRSPMELKEEVIKEIYLNALNKKSNILN